MVLHILISNHNIPDAKKSFSPKKKLLVLITFLFILLILLINYFNKSKGERWTVVEQTSLAMGTAVKIKIAVQDENENIAKANEVIKEAFSKIQYLESIASSYKKDSLVSKINQQAGISAVKVTDDFLGIIKEAQSISALTNGAFDITFAPLLKIWKLSEQEPRIPSDEEIKSTLKFVDYHKIEINSDKKTVFLKGKGMEIGLGAIAKGSAVDWAIEIIKKMGYNNALVDAGGDIYALGFKNPSSKNKWQVGIQHPRKKGGLLGIVEIKDNAIVTSGDYEKKIIINGKQYHHIFDPRTGRCADKSISVTVIASTCQLADALATGIFVLGPEEGLKCIDKLPDVKCLIISPQGHIYTSKNFPAGNFKF